MKRITGREFGEVAELQKEENWAEISAGCRVAKKKNLAEISAGQLQICKI